MSGQTGAPAARTLPDRPSLEHLKKQARRRLRTLRDKTPACRLADAQLEIARDYGFSSWRALKACVDGKAAPAGRFANLVGFYRHDPRVVLNGVITAVAEGGRLYLVSSRTTRLEITEQGDGRFAIAGVDEQFTFEGGREGPARALVAHGPRRPARMERIGEAEAKALLAARDAALAEQARPRTAIALGPGILERYVGHYASPFGPALSVEHRDGQLLVQVVGQPQVEVFAESETRFFYRMLPAQISFVTERGRVQAALLHQGGTEQRMERVSAEAAERAGAAIRERLAEQQRPRVLASIDPGLLERYAGRYRFDPDRVMEVAAKDGGLFVQATGQPRFEVHPESRDTFFWTVVAAQITFVAEPYGRITHAVLHQAGRDFPLARMDEEGPGA